MQEKLPFSYSTRRKRRRMTYLYKKQKGRCIYCKKQMWIPWDPEDMFAWTDTDRHNTHVNFKSRATLEHKKPTGQGGSKKSIKNQACSCSECNGKKGSLPHHVFVIVHRFDILYKLAKMYYRYRRSLRAMQRKRRRAAYS